MDNEIKQHKALDERTTMIKIKISGTARNFVVIGFYLKEIRDNEYFKDNGYKSLYEYADKELQMSKSTVSRFMSINDRFSVDGNSKELKGNYADYTVSQLSEMLTLTDDQLQEVSVGTTVAEIRNIKRQDFEPGCDGKCLVCTNDDCNCRQDKREHCIYHVDSPCTLAAAVTLMRATEPQLYSKCNAVCCFNCDMESECGYRCNRVHDITATEQKTTETERTGNNEQINTSKKSNWEKGIFEDDNEAYGWFRSEVVRAFYKDLSNNAIEADEIINTINVCGNKIYLFSCLNRYFIANIHDTLNGIMFYEKKENNRFTDDKEPYFVVAVDRIKKEYQDYLNSNPSYQDTTEDDAPQEAPKVETEAAYEQQELVATSQPVIESADKIVDQAAVPEKVVAEIIDKPKDKPKKIDTYSIEDYNKYSDTDIQSKLYQCDYDLQRYEKEKNKTHQPAITTMIKDALNILQKHRNENFEYPNKQPELPALKNNELRRQWVLDYRAWGIWYTDDKTEQRYYKYDFDDGSRLVAIEHKDGNHFQYEKKKKGPSDYVKTSYDFHLIEPGCHLVHYPNNITEIVDFLKNSQKRK